jgi:hypothetical protein
MGLPQQPVTLTPEEIAELNARLSDLRHNINNCLMKVTLAVDLIRTKPDVAARMTETIADQPAQIMAQLRQFSADFERRFGITREPRD